jgi:hypothetical protein
MLIASAVFAQAAVLLLAFDNDKSGHFVACGALSVVLAALLMLGTRPHYKVELRDRLMAEVPTLHNTVLLDVQLGNHLLSLPRNVTCEMKYGCHSRVGVANYYTDCPSETVVHPCKPSDPTVLFGCLGLAWVCSIVTLSFYAFECCQSSTATVKPNDDDDHAAAVPILKAVDHANIMQTVRTAIGSRHEDPTALQPRSAESLRRYPTSIGGTGARASRSSKRLAMQVQKDRDLLHQQAQTASDPIADIYLNSFEMQDRSGGSVHMHDSLDSLDVSNLQRSMEEDLDRRMWTSSSNSSNTTSEVDLTEED